MLRGRVGEDTFGVQRWLNQVFYRSKEWKDFRKTIIIRDSACDLAIPGREIKYGILIHHIEPITVFDIETRNVSKLLNPDNVITTVKRTHDAIHYGDETILYLEPVDRKPNDTIPWR